MPIMNRMTKTCTACGDAIGRNSRSLLCDSDLKKRYYQGTKSIRLAEMKAWREANKQRCRDNRKRWRQANRDKKRVTDMRHWSKPLTKYKAAERHARYRGIEWSIDLAFFETVLTQNCTYCGAANGGIGAWMDRIDNAQGYLHDNVVPCCGPCNYIRGKHLSYEEMKVAMKAVMELRSRPKLQVV